MQQMQSSEISQQRKQINEEFYQSKGLSPKSSTSGKVGVQQSTGGNLNIQQSNNYWHAERTFFNQDKNKNNIDELERMTSSIENIATPKSIINNNDQNKFSYIHDQPHHLNISNYRDSFCADTHEWPDQPSIDERENIDNNYDRKNEIHHQKRGSFKYAEDNNKLFKKNSFETNSNNFRCPVPQPGIQRQNEMQGQHRRIQSASGDIKSMLTANNHNNQKAQQQNVNGCQVSLNSLNNLSVNNMSVNSIANLNSAGGGLTNLVSKIGNNNEATKNIMVINMNVNKNSAYKSNNTTLNNSQITRNNSQNTTIINGNFTQTTGFSQNKLQDIAFSFSYVRKGASTISKNLFQFNSQTLQIVDLSFNKFRDVPPEVLEFPNLRVLKLDTNLIKVLNPDLFVKVQLEYFSISNNLLFEIPPRIIEWSETLKYLDISLNRIEDLSILPELKRLQSLHLHNNDFRYIPSSLSIFENTLQELSLDWFQYTNPPLPLRQSGLHGARIIQKVMNFFKMYKNQDQSIQQIVQKYRQSVQKQDTNDINFMEFVVYLSNPNIPYDINLKDVKDSNKQLSHKAAEREEIGCLISLLENQYDLINSLDDQGHTPLSLSILHEKFFSAKTLISNGSNVNIGGAGYGTCLNLATIKYQYYLVQDLLKKGANPNASDNEGNTPLHYIMTIFHKDPAYSAKISDLLLQFRSDPNLKNKDDWAPIHLIARRGQVDAFIYIQQYNKYLSENNYINTRIPEFINLPAVKDGTTNQYGVVSTQFMPFHINLKGGKEKQTPLHIACMHSCYDLVNQLLKSGADIFARNAYNKIAIHMCMRDNYLYKLLKQKESEVFNKFYSLQRQIEITSPTLHTCETPYKNNNISRTLTQQSQNQSSPRQQIFSPQQQIQSHHSLSANIPNKQKIFDDNTSKISNLKNSQHNLSSHQSTQQQAQNRMPNNAIQIANIIQNNLNSLSQQNQQNRQISNQNIQSLQSQSQFKQSNEPNRTKSQILQQTPSQQTKQQFSQIQIKNSDTAHSLEECEIMFTDNGEFEDKKKTFKNQNEDQNGENEYDISESQNTNRANNFVNLQGMTVKENSKNYNFIQEFEKQFNNQQSLDNQQQKQIRGQLVRNSLLLNKQKYKSGEEQNESLRAEELQGEFDDACVENEDDSTNKKLNYHLPSNPNYFQNNTEQVSITTAPSNQKYNQSQQKQNNNISGKYYDPYSQETRSQPNQRGLLFNEEIDEDLTKEEEFYNYDIDESKSMFELISTKKKIMNQSLPYAPNNIQQLNYIQAVNRTNIQKIQAQKAHHTRSKSNIEGIFQPKKIEPESNTKVKLNDNNNLKQVSTATKNQTKDDSNFQHKDYNNGLIKNDGLDAPPQIITPQHISFFNYLLEKAKNMHEYYSVSLQNYKKGILSEFNTLYEKFRYFVIMMKLQIEYQNMILHLINEKETLQSILGETPLFNLGVIDLGSSNLMIMKMLLDISENLKCENHKILQIQKDYPTPTEYNFLGTAMNANNNIQYWMRQYEESIHDTTMNSSQDKIELVDLSNNNKKNNERESSNKNAPKFYSDFNEEIKLYERENSILKENIIYQLGNFDFNESIDYLEKEIKSPDVSIINAFESCQSFFKIRESLYYKSSDINDNKLRKNKIGMDQKLKPKSHKEDSKALFSFPSNIMLSNQGLISQNKVKSSFPNSLTNVSQDSLSYQQKLEIKEPNKNTSKQQASSFYPSKSISNQSSILLTEQSDAVFTQKSIQQINQKQNANQQHMDIANQRNSQSQSQISSIPQINKQQSQSKQQDLSNALMTDLQQSNMDIKPTKPFIFQQNSNTLPKQNLQIIMQNYEIKQQQNNQPVNLAQRQVVLTEKALNKQITTQSTTINTTGSSIIKDKKKQIFDQFYMPEKKNSIDNKNKDEQVIQLSQSNSSDESNNSFNLIAPSGIQLDSSINNQYVDPFQKMDLRKQNSLQNKNNYNQQQFQQIQEKQQQQQIQQQSVLIPISQFKAISNNKNIFVKKQ